MAVLNRLRGLWRQSQGILFSAPADDDTADQVDDYTFRPVTPDHLDKDEIFAIRGRARRFHSRLGGSHQFLGFVSQENEVVSYVWLSVAEGASLDVPFRYGLLIRLCPGQAYIWDCATAASHQSRGLYRQGLTHARIEAARRNADQVYIFTDLDNAASIKGIMAAKFVEQSRITVLRRGPIRGLRVEGETADYYFGEGRSTQFLKRFNRAT